MSQGSFNPKIRFLCQKVCSVARVQTDTQIHRHTDTKMKTEDTLSGFEEFFLQPIIKDRSNIYVCVLCSSGTDRHESENRGHPFRVSGFFFKFSFNLSSRSGPKNIGKQIYDY